MVNDTEEKRIAHDGAAYTLSEYIQYYGKVQGVVKWKQSPLTPLETVTVGSRLPGASAGSGATVVPNESELGEHVRPGDASSPGEGAAQSSNPDVVMAPTSAPIFTSTTISASPDAARREQSSQTDAEPTKCTPICTSSDAESYRSWDVISTPSATSHGHLPLPPPHRPPEATVGAPQPGRDPWCDVPFFTDVLPRKTQELARHRRETPPAGRRHRSDTLRSTIDAAYDTFYEFLPLLTSTFTTIDIAQELGEPGAVVVAERIVRVQDPNRHQKNRVDIFCYKTNGDVVRYHPGTTARTSMKPHHMHFGSLLFSVRDAALEGVGAALHKKPPGMVALESASPRAGGSHPGFASPSVRTDLLLATPAHLEQLCTYDVHCVNWGLVCEELRLLPNVDRTVDWSDGSIFPWWVWLANTGKVHDVVNDGISRVEVSVMGGLKCVVVHSVGGRFELYSKANGDMACRPKPQKYARR